MMLIIGIIWLSIGLIISIYTAYAFIRDFGYLTIKDILALLMTAHLGVIGLIIVGCLYFRWHEKIDKILNKKIIQTTQK